MKPNRSTISIPHPRWDVLVTDDQSRTLIDRETELVFHSGCGAVSETRHVYLHNGGVAGRMRTGRPTSVLEIGLGTGLGLLLTLDEAWHSGTPLRFVSTERDWLPAETLEALEIGAHLRDPELAVSFLQWRRSLGAHAKPGSYRWSVSPKHEVLVKVGDVQEVRFNSETKFDAIYFDPFSPEENPELWQPNIFARMLDLLADEGKFVTYCVKSDVRHQMTHVGFVVDRVPGPVGGKREVMVATKSRQ